MIVRWRALFGGKHTYALLLFWTVWLVVLAAVSPAAAQKRISYNRDVRPILSEECFICHGVDSNRRQAGLRLDKPEIAYGKLPSGHIAVVPGDVHASELVARISTRGPMQMPPAWSNKKPLTPAQIKTLTLWVAQGAKYEPQWSYISPRRPPLPAVHNAVWPRNAIDRFVLARLESNGLPPSAPADRRTLIRRLSLDLTGLPPTPQEVDAFLRDTSPNAYEKVVDRLLASPHYGERLAAYWLDLVRYADTVGYHGDQEVSVWPYRDYVIKAFNTNKPFDVFTREQLAGDLLPNAGAEQRVASAYNRLGMMTTEGGAQDKEYRIKYEVDRVQNASLVWMGATLGCAQCHDHKYDPYTQRDFYRFAAFFADLKEQGYYGGGGDGDWGPSMRAPSAAQQAELTRCETQLKDVQRAIDAVSNASLADGRRRWEADLRARDAAKQPGWTVARPTQAVSSGGATMTIQPEGAVLVSGALPKYDTYTVTLPAPKDPITGIRLQALGDDSLPGDGVARSGHYFVLSEFEVAVRQGTGPEQPVPLVSAVADRESDGFPAMATIDGRPDTGWAEVYGGGETIVFRPAQPIRMAPGAQLVVHLRHQTKPYLAIGKLQISLSSLPQPDLSANGAPDDVLALIRKPEAQRTHDEEAKVEAAYRNVAPELADLHGKQAHLETARRLLLGQIPTTLVSEATTPRTIRILPRGNWMDDSGDVVDPGVPHFLPQIASKGHATRLDLANWITAPDNPLTARVFVNRLWQLFFGLGIVKTADDFGVQGEAPVNPELLDWLATEFVASGWDVKHIVRLIVTSSTYQQTSDVSPALLARDPENRLMARQTPRRLDAEFIRDVALMAAGVLSPRVGGPSARPYQPKGYLAALNFPRREWAPDAGEDLYRRGFYTFWQRSFLHPSLLAFDAPTREAGTCTRAVSNTPLQALVLTNDPIFVEAARLFAARILTEGGEDIASHLSRALKDPARGPADNRPAGGKARLPGSRPDSEGVDSFVARLNFAFQTALSRNPDPQEVAILRRLFSQELARYDKDRAAARDLISVGDSPVEADLDPATLAAWTAVARAILNLHETITRS